MNRIARTATARKNCWGFRSKPIISLRRREAAKPSSAICVRVVEPATVTSGRSRPRAIRETGRTVKLFHPRRQKWPEHFQWSADGARILGLTATGRATIEALQMNNDLIVNLRLLWVVLGLHRAK
jgi:hypothetical protein